MGLRERVDAAAKRAGFHSQTDLAVACGVKQPSINALVSEKYPMNDLLDKVAEVTKVSARWLRFGDDEVKPAWALSAELREQLAGVTAEVRRRIAQPKEPPIEVQTRDLLRDILAEMRANRALLERLAGSVQVRDAAEPGHVYQIGDLSRQRSQVHEK
jgi:hypothetical protein